MRAIDAEQVPTDVNLMGILKESVSSELVLWSVETRACLACEKVGHLVKDCLNKAAKDAWLAKRERRQAKKSEELRGRKHSRESNERSDSRYRSRDRDRNNSRDRSNSRERDHSRERSNSRDRDDWHENKNKNHSRNPKLTE